MKLLVVDWDFFFPIVERPEDGNIWLYDWGHSEAWSGSLQDAVWLARAVGFRRAGLDLPATNDEWRDFWPRFRFSDDAVLYVADSNVRAFDETITDRLDDDDSDEVWLFDAHHDAGYRNGPTEVLEEGRVSCEDWMIAYWLRFGGEWDSEDACSRLHVRYPRWRHYAMEDEEPKIPVERVVDEGGRVPVTFDTVMVCRSGSWTPPWVDGDFASFLQMAPLPVIELDASGLTERPVFDVEDLDERAAMEDELMRLAEERTGG